MRTDKRNIVVNGVVHSTPIRLTYSQNGMFYLIVNITSQNDCLLRGGEDKMKHFAQNTPYAFRTYTIHMYISVALRIYQTRI